MKYITLARWCSEGVDKALYYNPETDEIMEATSIDDGYEAVVTSKCVYVIPEAKE